MTHATSDVEIVPPQTRDLDDLVALWRKLVRSQRPYGTRILVEENVTTAREWLAQLLVVGGILSATSEGKPIGFVTFEMEVDRFVRSDRSGIVHNLFVDPEFRGRGIGARLMERAEERLRERGADRIRVEVMATNERARNFYETSGYHAHRVRYHKTVRETDNTNSTEREG